MKISSRGPILGNAGCLTYGSLLGWNEGETRTHKKDERTIPLLGTFEAEDSGVSGDVVSAPSSKTWI